MDYNNDKFSPASGLVHLASIGEGTLFSFRTALIEKNSSENLSHLAVAPDFPAVYP